MPPGVPTTAEVEAEFRAHYLYSGNATESAKAVNLPERTGRDLAKRLSADPSFAADRRALRARALDELVSMRMRVAQISLERFESSTGGVDVKDYDGDVTITDKRHEYGKLVIESEKAAQHLAKLDPEEKQFGSGGLTIVVRPTAEAQQRLDNEDDGSPSGEP